MFANSTNHPTTCKQFGDACEQHVCAQLMFAGIPTLIVPDCWPDYDLIAQPIGTAPKRISVKGRRQTAAMTGFDFDPRNIDVLVLVLFEGPNTVPRCFVIPCDALPAVSCRLADDRHRVSVGKIKTGALAPFENAFGLVA
jgi:hypothetical protein